MSSATTTPTGFRDEFLWELGIVIKQIGAIAEAIPADKFGWRPDPSARSVSQVFVHVAAGNFMLLDQIGVAAPIDLFNEIPAEGEARLWAMVHKNDEMELTLVDKEAVVAFLKRSLDLVAESMGQAGDSEIKRRIRFFGNDTTVRRVYLRMLAHGHEHMGQMIAYTRAMGLPMPWPDWRPDRRGEA